MGKGDWKHEKQDTRTPRAHDASESGRPFRIRGERDGQGRELSLFVSPSRAMEGGFREGIRSRFLRNLSSLLDVVSWQHRKPFLGYTIASVRISREIRSYR